MRNREENWGMIQREPDAPSIKVTIIWLLAFSFIVGFIIIGKTIQAATVNRDRILNVIDTKWTANFDVPPRRGSIKTRGGSILAISEKTYEVVLDPMLVDNPAVVSQRLSTVLGVPLSDLLRETLAARDLGKKFVPVKDGLDRAEMTEVRNLNLRGVFILSSFKRFYPFRDQMSPHTVGFIRKRDGVFYQAEKAFDDLLSGTPGKVYYHRDSHWGKLPGTTYVKDEVVNGRDVYLTLDENIQIISEIELDLAMGKNKSEWGLIAVMDPYTGEILADAVRPTFDPNDCVAGGTVSMIASNPLYSYVVEPGSVLKPIIIAGAYNRGSLDIDDEYYCPSSLKVLDIVIREAHEGKAFGWTTVRQGVVSSSNVLMASVGLDLGLNEMMKIFEGAMLFHKPGLGFPTETAGLPPEHAIKDERGRYPEKFDTDEATAGYGQGLAITPLALLTAYAEIANGGFAVQPKIVLGTAEDIGGMMGEPDRVQAGYVPFDPGPTPRSKRNTVYKPETIEKIRGILIDVVNSEGGTGSKARLSSGLTVAGKTGTAEVAGKNGKYVEGWYLSSFVGFFPAERPRYVVLVMFSKPRGKYYGGDVAAPVFAKIADRICYLDRIDPESI